MERSGETSVTQLLIRWSEGDESAAANLFPLVYDELHRIAERIFQRERSDHTLQATAVIHEAYLNLTDGDQIDWKNRAHFFGLMARVMRRVLVDHARQRSRIKRGGVAERITLEDEIIVEKKRKTDVIKIDDALKSLEKADPQKAAIVELRFFGGMTIEETAEALDISATTVVRQWRLAKAWLYRELAAE